MATGGAGRHRRPWTVDFRPAVVRFARRVNVMTAARSARRRDGVYRLVTLVLAVLFVPAAAVLAGRRAGHLACRWALAARFPAEDLTGLHPATRAAFEAARRHALWRHGRLLGLTSGHRSAEEQARLFAAAVWQTGSVAAARGRVLPPQESRHVAGTALDVRPAESADWLDRHGAAFGLYRTYDNEWWHFEHRPEGRPERLPSPRFIDDLDMIPAWTS